jgi:hypothetical protein
MLLTIYFLSNKIGQSVEITWMKETLVSHEYGMEVMDHKDTIFYGKYILKL